ncbi:LRR receptor-like serine/threonine-protein kinase GSO1 [Vitis vinifera]|uniref:LRR receptor-like serine/threonine-protein kinase GSO1 n=1 Tax=Vitis vinifera TaxID=29760 RepID=A0A438ID41_VITVI|nr:LRR receptor-like serine/threonine-protein kinase GSO1 [Vitis vinifera]
MATSPFRYFISLFLLLLCFEACLRVGDAKVGCRERERQALLHFKQDVVDYGGVLSSWGNGEDKRDCCKWAGVECNNQTGHVIMLDLHGGYLGGKISQLGPSLAELQHLKHLNLSFNDFQGILPINLGNLSNLQSLDLGNNYGDMSCENLDWLSHLPSLTHLDLSFVNLSKAIHWPQAINKMPSLTELYLSHTELPPIIPTISISHINSSTSLAVLHLSSNGLTSSIYPWLFCFSSGLVHLDLSMNDLNCSIPDAFGNMTTLAYLDLSWNKLRGSIPDAFGNMTTLAYLDLSSNELHGSIPDAFGNMTTLAYLDLSWNQLEGEILKSLRDLCNLQTLLLSQNNLTGLLEKDFLACSNNTLENLDLSSNQFRGSFPHLSGFSQMRVLYLKFNQLNGTLPESIGQLAQLQVLSIRSNSLRGTVSANHLFGLSNLFDLDLSFNSLTFNISLEQVPQFRASRIMLASCKLGPHFPNWLQTQEVLRKLDISASGISDVIPNWFWNLTSDLQSLNISNNHISGTLPNLQATPLILDMSSNCLEGSIPQSVFNAGWLDLSKNLFSGSISLSCGTTNQSSGGLLHLDLSNNRLSGELPKCWEQWEDLIVLDLANNNFSGKIKNSIGLLHGMQTLHLRNNSFTGALPSSLKNCRALSLIDLGKNKLSGKITAWIGGSLSDLIVLNLRSNEFNGSIPSSLCQLKQIQMLDLSSNNLSGKIPKCLKNLTAMAQKGSQDLSYEALYNSGILLSYVDNTLVQWKGKEQEYKKTLGLIKSIDFSSNKLIGEIPIEVTDLVELVSLNLSRNNLIGSIPTTIGQLKLLDFLDLSQNQLNGRISENLSQIAGLSVLDLSNNTLSGKIPLGTQLQSFDASTYEGNPGLCGPPLLKRCPEDELGGVSFTNGLSSKKEDIQDDANNIWFYGNIVLGFIIGFWGVCGTLLFNSSWRYAYFQFLSKIKDWLLMEVTLGINHLQGTMMMGIGSAAVKTNYGKFKDHKRCTYMIVNALDGDDTLTAAQVSHKLKQQLAYVPHQKRAEDNLHLRDEDLNGCDIAKAQYSNDETLFSLRKRCKKENHRLLSEEIAASRFGYQSPSEDDNIEIAVKVWVFVTMPVEASSDDI